ncbi:hypothetical protein AMECASPLE_022546 [Ameca splendens]|uniref:Uncharacterized protein n=1 Tax=Ameca splendens TaxID=208324 RepID=A0ABV1A017_9TELE
MHWRKATTARQGPGIPPTPHPNPGGDPGCRPPTFPHGTPRCTKQAGQPLYQSEGTSQSALHTARPTDGAGTEASDQVPMQSKHSQEGQKASIRQPPRPVPQPQPRSRPKGLFSLPASNPRPPKCTPVRRRRTASRSKNMPNTHTTARSSPARKPTPKPTKGREPTEPKPKPTKRPRPAHPEINPGQPARPNHTDPYNPNPQDRTGPGVRNRNPEKEPESELEPPRSK